MEHFCNVHCQLEGGIVFPFFQVHNGFAPDADQLGKVCLLKALCFPGFYFVVKAAMFYLHTNGQLEGNVIEVAEE